MPTSFDTLNASAKPIQPNPRQPPTSQHALWHGTTITQLPKQLRHQRRKRRIIKKRCQIWQQRVTTAQKIQCSDGDGIKLKIHRQDKWLPWATGHKYPCRYRILTATQLFIIMRYHHVLIAAFYRTVSWATLYDKPNNIVKCWQIILQKNNPKRPLHKPATISRHQFQTQLKTGIGVKEAKKVTELA